MSSETIFITPHDQGQNDSKSLSSKQVLSKYLYHWPLFLLFIVSTLSIAYFYNRYNLPVYTVTAKLLIADEKNDHAAESVMQKMDIFGSSKVVENESEILQSKMLISEVVNKLKLWTSYSEKTGLKNTDLYTASPVQIQLLTPPSDSLKENLRVYIKSRLQFVLLNKDGTGKEFYFGTRLKSGFGSWRLNTTSTIDQHIGSTIGIALIDTLSAVDSYADNVKATRVNKLASVLELSLQDHILKRGDDIMHSLVAAYDNQAVTEKKRVAESALKFIDGRIITVSSELETIEKHLEGYQSSQGITNVTAESTLLLENLKTNDAALNDVNVQLNIIDEVEKYVKSSKSTNSAPATIGISDPGLSGLIKQLMELQAQRDKMLANTPEINHVFDSVNGAIKSTKAAILENISGIKSSLLASKRQLVGTNGTLEASIKNIPGQERQLISIKRQQTNKENLYLYLLQKREEAALSYASTLNDSRLIDYEYTKTSNKRLIYVMALALGIFLPLSIIYGREYFNDKINTKRDIEDETSIPIISEISYYDGKVPLMIGQRNGNFEIGEQFRQLRFGLHLAQNSKVPGRVTLLTSGIAAEGKSFVTSYLGLSLAASARRVIILELDIHSPQIIKKFNLDANAKGLCDFLLGEATLEEIIQVSELNPNVSVISAGTCTLNSQEMLEQDDLDQLINKLKESYDDILIDTPPINFVSDAMVLLRVSDITLYIVRQGFTRAWELASIEKLYKQKKIPKLNIVFNGVKKDRYNDKQIIRYAYTQSGANPYQQTPALALKSFLTRF
jgi:tyrosine-protein kinase Etk/Wzc